MVPKWVPQNGSKNRHAKEIIWVSARAADTHTAANHRHRPRHKSNYELLNRNQSKYTIKETITAVAGNTSC